MPAVVADTSPLIYLTRLGHLDWLREMFGEIIIPEAVWDEVTVKGAGYPEASSVFDAVKAEWMVVRKATPEILDRVDAGLDPGETEAIALAEELRALLIIDELDGRRVAMSKGIRVTGTGGIILIAKLKGLTPSLKFEIDRLVQETSFRISNELRLLLLEAASEADSES